MLDLQSDHDSEYNDGLGDIVRVSQVGEDAHRNYSPTGPKTWQIRQGSNDPLKLDVVWRFDTRPPEVIFKEGFVAPLNDKKAIARLKENAKRAGAPKPDVRGKRFNLELYLRHGAPPKYVSRSRAIEIKLENVINPEQRPGKSSLQDPRIRRL